ncbi:MAG: hypothetical protein PHF86_02475 [Candidatus Nanoarchaeia archaeon]|nr:hypothetical protein [Candidatus Nanoarchaeia archaeon]
MALIDEYLHFEEHPTSKKLMWDNEQWAHLSDDSTIHRCQNKNGCCFQLFLKNTDNYNRIKNSEIEGIWKAHFYGGNYIYLPPGSHIIIDICKYMGWRNEKFIKG